MKYSIHLPGETLAEDHAIAGKAFLEHLGAKVEPEEKEVAIQDTRYARGRDADRMFKDYILRTIIRHANAGKHVEAGCPFSCFKKGTTGDAAYRREIVRKMWQDKELSLRTGIRSIRYLPYIPINQEGEVK